MDSADVTPFGAWASIRGYFTPATLFLLVNLVIGTIALTSRSHQRRRREHHDDGHPHPRHQEPLQQLHPHQQQEYHYYQQQPLYATPPPAPLARTSSVLDRLRSLGLYRFRSGDFPPEYGAAGATHTQDVFSPVEETTKQAHCARSRSEPAPAREEKRTATKTKKSGSEVRKAQVARAPASRVVEEDEAVDARAEEFIGSFRRQPSPPKVEYHYQEEYVPPPAPAPAPLARTSSVLDRLRSLGLYGFLAPEQPTAASTPARDGFPNATPVDEKKQAHAHYDRSRSEPAWGQGKKEKKQGVEARMSKSSSGAKKAAAPNLGEEETDKCIDARAEAFINNFKRERSQQQLHHDQEEHVPLPPQAPAPLARTSSVLDRLRSFGLYLRSGDLGHEDPVPASTPAADEKKQARYGRSRSEPEREQGKEKKQGAEARMSKSSSEAGVVEAEAEQCVDARADDFINKFRQQLQLQRLNSLLNYKEMLNRGGSKQ
ncbi:pathogen-associated molecular patterns-induced protein A70-like [Phragmites australis]|uniref:pathogen-associated molecular patterns-induced protein A70-like n=1 Tax=Phragmites australis TaxID=29695 RepID=UPI002D76AE75|nr:pathogen-associated molecular patterns-induced protein A70-like [Phragmites australis]